MNENQNAEARCITLLLVEDNEDDIFITEESFRRAKFKNPLQVARDGEEAWDYLNGRGQFADRDEYPLPDLVLLDINMPKMNGFQLLERMKGHEEFRLIPVIMLTSSNQEKDVARSYKYGAATYIQKPIEFEAFMEVARKFNFYWQLAKLPSVEPEHTD